MDVVMVVICVFVVLGGALGLSVAVTLRRQRQRRRRASAIESIMREQPVAIQYPRTADRARVRRRESFDDPIRLPEMPSVLPPLSWETSPPASAFSDAFDGGASGGGGGGASWGDDGGGSSDSGGGDSGGGDGD